MKILFLFILCTLAAVNSREYHYNTPGVGFHQEDVPQNIQKPTIIKGNFGPSYEVTMLPSQKLLEARLEERPQIPNQQPSVALAPNHNNQQYQNQYTTINSHPVYPFNQYTATNQQQSSPIINQYPGQNSNGAFSNTQQHLRPPSQQTGPLTTPAIQYSTIYVQHHHLNPPQPLGVPNNGNPAHYPNANNGHFQQPVNQYSTTNPQILNQYPGRNSYSVIPANTQQHLNQYSNQQQQHPHQQHHPGLIPPHQNNNNAANSNNLLNDLVNNNKYVSQSEASQLDAYSYKQFTNANIRPFTRFTTTCKGVGDCVQHNGDASKDFQHQQVLKQSRAQIETISDKCRSNGNYDYSPNSLTDNQNAAKHNSAKKGTNLRDRRLFPYTEQVISQYPHN